MYPRDKFEQPIFIGSLVAVATNSGIYVGKVTKFNITEYSSGIKELSTVQVHLTDGKKFSYDKPNERMVNLDTIHDVTGRLWP